MVQKRALTNGFFLENEIMKVKVSDLCPKCRNTIWTDGKTIEEMISLAQAGMAAKGMPDDMFNLAIYYNINCDGCQKHIKDSYNLRP